MAGRKKSEAPGEAGETKEEELTLEEAFERLDGTITALEAEDITLEEAFRTYREGMRLLRYCNGTIDKVEKKVLEINQDGGLDEF